MTDAALAGLVALLGPEGVATDDASRALAAADVFPSPDAVLPDVVLRPRTTEQVAAAIRLLAAQGRCVTPRGGGLSYTGGVVPQAPGVAIDLRGIRFVHVVPEDLYAVVGAGCTWQALAEALRPHGLRPAPVPPISGSHATIGGAASQGISGSEGMLGLAVVLADGTVVRTGTWSTPGAEPFARHYGPDLTGLFIGDCGAFGIKTEVVLRLEPPAERRFASFGYGSGAGVIEAMAGLQRGPGGKCIAFDRARGTDATARIELGAAARTIAAVAGQAASLGQAVRDVLAMRRTRDELAEAPWSLHLTAEGATPAIAAAQMEAMRAVCLDAGGVEMPASVPQALDARPFSVRGMVGPEGERWVPVHGYLALSKTAACFAAVERHIDAHAAEYAAHGIRVNHLLTAHGARITMEPMFYWRDALDPLHLAHLSERNRARFGGFAPDPAARAFVGRQRLALRDLMDGFGAAHGQLGRFYVPPASGAEVVLARVKAALDPTGMMNPGVLGLGMAGVAP